MDYSTLLPARAFVAALLLMSSSMDGFASAHSLVTQELYDNFSTQIAESAQTMTVNLADAAASYGELDLDVASSGQEDDYIYLTGAVAGYEGSNFLFKGTAKDLYGSITFPGSNTAYEFTTSADGLTTVTEVPYEKIIPICFNNFNTDALPPSFLERKDETFPIAWDKTSIAKLPLHIQPYSDQDLMKLESKPGAPKVLWLDIRAIMRDGKPIPVSKKEMYENWQATAAGFSFYDVNVTTNKAIYDKAGVRSSGHVKYFNKKGRSNAYLNSFGTKKFVNMYLDKTGYGYGRTTFHEVGHQVGLSHDKGKPGGEYFEGIPEFKWVPIMGNYWFGNAWKADALYQFSKGEYSSAKNKEDDYSNMAKHLKVRADDNPNGVPLKVNGHRVEVVDNFGLIETNTDSDTFTISVESAGQLKLKIDRIEYIGGAMLDVHAELKDSSGRSIAKDNPKAARYANISAKVQPGEYKLIIKGGAEGTPNKGFSNYGSIGYYGISGTIN